jgi:hypothetical protein
VAAERDPLSKRYDTMARRVLVAAIRARPSAYRVFVESPPREFRDTDQSGRTQHERAFTRSLYYHVVQIPRRRREPQQWSLRLVWGPIERRGGRWGRRVTLRMFTVASGRRHTRKRPGTSYVERPELRSHAALAG